jgi:3-methylcrotonyl-CoA carboxylase beta subunit
LARRIVGTLNRVKKPQLDLRAPEEPLYSADEIGGIIGDNLRKPFDSKNIISRIVDGSRFAEFKEHYGTSLVTGKPQDFFILFMTACIVTA